MQQLFLMMCSLLIILTFDHENTKFNEQTNTQNIDCISSFHPQDEVDPRVLVCHISGRVLDGELWRADGSLAALAGDRRLHVTHRGQRPGIAPARGHQVSIRNDPYDFD